MIYLPTNFLFKFATYSTPEFVYDAITGKWSDNDRATDASHRPFLYTPDKTDLPIPAPTTVRKTFAEIRNCIQTCHLYDNERQRNSSFRRPRGEKVLCGGLVLEDERIDTYIERYECMSDHDLSKPYERRVAIDGRYPMLKQYGNTMVNLDWSLSYRDQDVDYSMAERKNLYAYTWKDPCVVSSLVIEAAFIKGDTITTLKANMLCRDGKMTLPNKSWWMYKDSVRWCEIDTKNNKVANRSDDLATIVDKIQDIPEHLATQASRRNGLELVELITSGFFKSMSL